LPEMPETFSNALAAQVLLGKRTYLNAVPFNEFKLRISVKKCAHKPCRTRCGTRSVLGMTSRRARRMMNYLVATNLSWLGCWDFCRLSYGCSFESVSDQTRVSRLGSAGSA